MNLTLMQDSSERLIYNDPSIPLYVRPGDLVGFSGMAALCHWHEDVEILMPLRGYLNYNVNGTVVTVEEGDAIFVNSRQLHYGFSADGTDCQYVCIVFRPQMLSGNETIQNRYILPVLTSPNFTHIVLREAVPKHRELLRYLHCINSLYREQAQMCEIKAVCQLNLFWTGLFTLVRDSVVEAISTDINALMQKHMLEYIRAHYRERITLDDIAASGGVCRTKCCQIFKRYLGRSPNDYLNSFRLEKGMELLKGTGLRVTEIAEACGYSSASYFTEMFTKQKGCSPTQFRKNCGIC